MLHLLSTIALGPVLLIQGKSVRNNIEVLPEPEGARTGVMGNGPILRLLITGDSAGAGVGSSHQDQALLGQLVSQLAPHYEVHFRLEATSGDNSADCLAKLEQLAPQPFDVVITSLGVNDVTSGCSKKKFEQRQRALLALFKTKFNAQQVILSGLPPVGHFPALPQPLRWYLGAQATRFDRIVERLSQEHGCDYIKFDFDGDTSPIATDGFHPGPRVYALWAELAATKVLGR